MTIKEGIGLGLVLAAVLLIALNIFFTNLALVIASVIAWPFLGGVIGGFILVMFK